MSIILQNGEEEEELKQNNEVSDDNLSEIDFESLLEGIKEDDLLFDILRDDEDEENQILNQDEIFLTATLPPPPTSSSTTTTDSPNSCTSTDIDGEEVVVVPGQEIPLPSSPIFGSFSIDEIEQMLMRDDDDNKQVNMEEDEEKDNRELCKQFFPDFITDLATPPPNLLPSMDQSVVDVEARVSIEDCSNPESNLSDDSQEKDSDGSDMINNNKRNKSKDNDGDGDGNGDDPIIKKRKRQMRNRDAALRSRERKKEYVRDLEMKSRYLESECRRLQHLLNCCVAENQNLHLHLHNQKAFGASMTKQESAVLFLESLLLGSLLWFLGIMCLFPLQGLVLPNHRLPASVLVVVNVGKDSLEVEGLRSGNKGIGLGMLRLIFKRKRCTATRSKMKETVFIPHAAPPAAVA